MGKQGNPNADPSSVATLGNLVVTGVTIELLGVLPGVG